MINPKADGIPVYEVKNERTGKKKVLHRARLLLWLADYGEPVRCNLMMISDTLPGTVLGQQLDDSGEELCRTIKQGMVIVHTWVFIQDDTNGTYTQARGH